MEAVTPRLILGPKKGFKINIEIPYIGNMFKNLLLKNYSATVCEITMQESLAIVDSKLVKS